MAHSYARVAIHIVFATKGRRNLISDRRQQELYAYIIGIARNKGIPVIAVGGMPNHIHILIGLPGTISFSDAISILKANSSRFMGRVFAWQKGFGAFSVSHSQIETVVRYIRKQEEHHKKRSFEEEFLLLLKKAGIDYDPATVFE